MSREIKFRAWDKEKKWLFKIFDSVTQEDWFLPCWKSKYEVMQYTGLEDKNGKEIYEGDIVLVADDEGCSEIVDSGIGEIEFFEGFWYICGTVQNGLYDIGKRFRIEIIGNIYENPDLLNRR